MAQLFTPDLYARYEWEIEHAIQAIQRRKGLSGADAEDFAQDARLHLIRNACHALRCYRGKSGCDPRTYLHTVLSRLLINRRNQQRGRWRPSARARRTGAVAIELERLVARDGLQLAEALTMLTCDAVSRAQLEDMASSLRLHPRPRVRVDVVSAERCPGMHSADEGLAELEALAGAARVRAALRAALERLSEHDRRLLELRFMRGCEMRVIAETLGVPRRRLYARCDRVLARLRRALTKAGVDEALVRSTLSDHAFDLLDA